jgi:hypothetical protein
LERFSSTKHLISVDSRNERFDFRVQVNGDRMPFSCRKLGQLLHCPQEADSGSAHEEGTTRHYSVPHTVVSQSNGIFYSEFSTGKLTAEALLILGVVFMSRPRPASTASKLIVFGL